MAAGGGASWVICCEHGAARRPRKGRTRSDRPLPYTHHSRASRHQRLAGGTAWWGQRQSRQANSVRKYREFLEPPAPLVGRAASRFWRHCCRLARKHRSEPPITASRCSPRVVDKRCDAAVGLSVGYSYRIEFAPFPQRSFGRFRFEIVPAINHVPSRQQGSEFRVRASPVKYVSNLIKIIRKEFARKVQRQRLTETELTFRGDRHVFLIILDVVGQLIVQLVEFGKFGVPVDLARLPAQNGLMFAEAVGHPDKLERLK